MIYIIMNYANILGITFNFAGSNNKNRVLISRNGFFRF
jgi:hypothetical protein